MAERIATASDRCSKTGPCTAKTSLYMCSQISPLSSMLLVCTFSVAAMQPWRASQGRGACWWAGWDRVTIHHLLLLILLVLHICEMFLLILINILQRITVWCIYNQVTFLSNPHNRHPVAHQWRWYLGCLMCLQTVIYILPQSLQYHRPWHVILYHVITAPDCMNINTWPSEIKLLCCHPKSHFTRIIIFKMSRKIFLVIIFHWWKKLSYW